MTGVYSSRKNAKLVYLRKKKDEEKFIRKTSIEGKNLIINFEGWRLFLKEETTSTTRKWRAEIDGRGCL